MRIFYLFILLFSIQPVFSQEATSVCFILYVKGEIKKPSGQKLIQGDTISLNDLTSLKFETPGAVANFFETSAGSFRMTEKEIIAPGGHENFFSFLKHLLKIKGQPVSLSSRGECTCITPMACFFADTAINDKVLLLEELSFKADEIIDKAEEAFYFLQYNNQKRKLKITDGQVRITPSDFVFKDTSFTNETPELTIGLYVKESGNKHSDLIANVKFNIVSSTVLKDYYRSLQLALPDKDLSVVYKAFCDDVYLYFGKPTECQVQKIINTIND